MTGLVVLFFLTALVYASAGFGGGSAYLPLMVFWNVDYRLLPAIALICNMIVVSGGIFNFARAGHFNWRFALPFVLLSVPLAWLGGQIDIDPKTFRLILGLVLICSAVMLLLDGVKPDKEIKGNTGLFGKWIGVPIGGVLGIISGITGIGGGVFLAPVLHGLRLAPAKVIAATCSLFIFVNSGAGFAAQAQKLAGYGMWEQLLDHAPLFFGVLMGGLIGNYISIRQMSTTSIKRVTAVILFAAGGRLFYEWIYL